MLDQFVVFVKREPKSGLTSNVGLGGDKNRFNDSDEPSEIDCRYIDRSTERCSRMTMSTLAFGNVSLILEAISSWSYPPEAGYPERRS